MKFLLLETVLMIDKWPRSQLVMDGLYSSDFQNLLVVSHRWLTILDPDPDSEQLREVQNFIKGSNYTHVFYDYSSLPQHPRTDSENEQFDKDIASMNSLYENHDVLILQNGSSDYHTRGWCFMEWCLSLGRQKGNIGLFPELHDVGGKLKVIKNKVNEFKYDESKFEHVWSSVKVKFETHKIKDFLSQHIKSKNLYRYFCCRLHTTSVCNTVLRFKVLNTFDITMVEEGKRKFENASREYLKELESHSELRSLYGSILDHSPGLSGWWSERLQNPPKEPIRDKFYQCSDDLKEARDILLNGRFPHVMFNTFDGFCSILGICLLDSGFYNNLIKFNLSEITHVDDLQMLMSKMILYVSPQIKYKIMQHNFLFHDLFDVSNISSDLHCITCKKTYGLNLPELSDYVRLKIAQDLSKEVSRMYVFLCALNVTNGKDLNLLKKMFVNSFMCDDWIVKKAIELIR